MTARLAVERRADGSLAPAPSQSSYWVVERLSPSGGQEARLGVDEGSEPRGGTAKELGAFIQSENTRWGEIVRQSGARVE